MNKLENDSNEFMEQIQKLASYMDTPAQSQTDTEQLYRSILEELPVLICSSLPGGTITFANKAYCDYFGKTHDELVGSNFTDLIPEADRDTVMANIDAMTPENPSQSHEHRVIAADGAIRWQRWTNKAVFDDLGNPIAYKDFGEDITDRKLTRKKLDQSLERLIGFMGSATDGFILFDSNLNHIEINKAALGMTGHLREDVIGRNVLDIVPDLMETGRYDKYKEVMRTGVPLFIPDFMPHPKFGRKHMELKAFKVGDGLGMVFSDITDKKAAERELHDSRRNLQAIINASFDSILLVQMDGTVIECNDSVVSRLNCGRDEFLGSNAYDHVPTDVAQGRRKRAQHVFDTGEPVRFEDQRLGRVIDQCVYPVKDEMGEVTHMAIFGSDITDRRKAEHSLAQSEQRLRSILENTDAGYFFIDKDGIIRNVNPAWLAMYGYRSPDEIIGQHFNVIQQQDDLDEAQKYVEEIMNGNPEYLTGEFSRKCKDGSVGYHSFSARSVTEDGQAIGIEGFIINITKRKQYEQALKDSEQRFKSLSEAAFEGIVFSETGIFADANEAFCRMFGYTVEELKGRTVMELVAPEHREFVSGRIRSGYDGAYEHKALHKDGHIVDVEVHGHTVIRGSKSMRLTAIRDITESNEVRRLQRKHQEELAHAWRVNTMGEMASGLAHELNQPLCAVLNYANACLQMINRSNDIPDNFTTAITAITAQAERAGKIIRRIRSLIAKREPTQSAVDVNRVVADVVETERAEAEQQAIAIVTDLAENLPAVLADNVEIEEVILNLVRNAIDAMIDTPRGGRRVTIKTTLNTDDMIQLSVTDTGKGLPDVGPEGVFESFFTTKDTGLGIGLSISRSIVESHKGKIWAAPRPDHGATFIFTLPKARSADPGNPHQSAS